MRKLVLPLAALGMLAFAGSALAGPCAYERTAQAPLETVSTEQPQQTPKPQG